MTRILVGTDSVESSEQLLTYLEPGLDGDDQVFILNSLVGGGETSDDDIADGDAALDVLEEGLAHVGDLERHQYIRGNQPVEDLLAAAEDWNADELAIGIRKRSPVGKIVFGSTAQNLLLEADRPVRCVPLVSE